MKNIARLAAMLSFIGAALVGCVVPMFESANLVGPLPAYGGKYLIRLEQVRGPPKFHGGHAFGMIARTMYVHTIWLPGSPRTKSTYLWKELRVEEMDDGGQRRDFKALSGTVVVDKETNTVVVDLGTKESPFPGNGEYRLKIQ